MTPILITSPASRAGKNYTGKLLRATLGGVKFPIIGNNRKYVDIKEIAIADSLKTAVHELFWEIGAQTAKTYEEVPEKRKEILYNDSTDIVDLWIKFGEFCKTVDPDVWVRKAVAQFGQRDYAIVTDLRFNSEYEFILARYPNTKVIRVIRTDGKESKRKSDDLYTAHVDYTLYNDGTDEYKKIVQAVARNIQENLRHGHKRDSTSKT